MAFKAEYMLFLSDVDCILKMARATRTVCVKGQLCLSLLMMRIMIMRIRPHNVHLLVYLVARGQRGSDTLSNILTHSSSYRVITSTIN